MFCFSREILWVLVCARFSVAVTGCQNFARLCCRFSSTFLIFFFIICRSFIPSEYPSTWYLLKTFKWVVHFFVFTVFYRAGPPLNSSRKGELERELNILKAILAMCLYSFLDAGVFFFFFPETVFTPVHGTRDWKVFSLCPPASLPAPFSLQA